ncbi:hypothetical protein FACS1894111_08150 [Clostridia bacterium]|nr:hypothetical protein FACS1894111_08150 [Clostridia bacterium]
MITTMSIGNMLNSIVPISRFNNGEAAKVFDEVEETGCKIVVKNNVPACVLLTPEKYQELIELLDNEYLYALALEREMKDAGKSYSATEVMEQYGITDADIDNAEDDEIE